MKKILLASDHNGVELKAHIFKHLSEKGYHCIDLGPSKEDGKVGYPDYAFKLAKRIDEGEDARGILICGTGQGMSISANKLRNVRAALVHDVEVTTLSRDHNDTNVLCFGAWIITTKRAESIVDSWLSTPFGKDRHSPRIDRLKELSSDPTEDIIRRTFDEGKRTILTSGIFDGLHTNHIELIKFAKILGDKLIVAINSDRSVRELKGPNRPINNQEVRKKALEDLGIIDEILIFDDVDPLSMLLENNPDVYVKGGEWTAEEVRKRDRIPQNIEISIFPISRT